MPAGFRPASTQVSATVTYPGVVKAFHYHNQQSDCWTVVKGMLQVALADLRRDSPTFGQRNTLYIGETSDLLLRVGAHKEGRSTHTARRRPVTLVHVEPFPNRRLALLRERQLKGWTRAKKEALIRGNLAELKRL